MTILLLDFDSDEAVVIAEILKEAAFEATISPDPPQVPTTDWDRFEVVIIGGHDPQNGGGHLCAALRKSGYAGALVAMGPREPRSLGVAALDAGADDFVFRPVDARELAARVRAVSRRVTGRLRLTWKSLTLDRAYRAAYLHGQPLALTTREYAILSCLVEAGGTIVTRAELLSRVWRRERDPGSNLVEVHLSRLRDKLGSGAAMIETVRRGGYRLRP